ncbi:MAG TPA: hypothetical protein VM183_18455 [Burkholderiales bacterium]|nr:hypothetical protein [Burkholderiales bacterium]
MGMTNKAADRAHDAIDQANDEAAALADGTEKFLETTSKYIAAHPLQALGLAFAAGYLLSRLTRR